jgi:hypothetical protein
MSDHRDEIAWKDLKMVRAMAGLPDDDDSIAKEITKKAYEYGCIVGRNEVETTTSFKDELRAMPLCDRMNTYHTALVTGLLTVNEIREIEGLPAIKN